MREVKGMIREAGVSMVRSVKEVGDGKVVAVFVRDQEKEKVKQALQDKKEVRMWEKGVQAPNSSRGWKVVLPTRKFWWLCMRRIWICGMKDNI